ncbi:hypothetical protein JCM10207_006919 [Rhodosporidiobolus poonsookiae]
MQLPTSLILLISAFASAQLVQGRPAPHRSAPRDVTISHKSLATGATTTHSIDAALLPAELAQAIDGNDININLTTDRVKRSPSPATGINNSTINLTVIGSRKRAAAAPAAQHHNIHIDASSSGKGGLGGIHNSTLNINLNSAASKRKLRRKVNLGDHSVLVDVSSAGSDSGAEGGIEDSTVHVNILPPRALNKSAGHHSIVVDSSNLGSNEAAQSSTTTGANSAVVDTSSAGANSTASGSTGVKNSTINLTVISPKDEPAAAPAAAAPSPAEDGIEAPLPSLARLGRRSTAAFETWSASIQRKDLAVDGAAEEEQPAAPAGPEPSGFAMVHRNHNSKPATLSHLAKRA